MTDPYQAFQGSQSGELRDNFLGHSGQSVKTDLDNYPWVSVKRTS